MNFYTGPFTPYGHTWGVRFILLMAEYICMSCAYALNGAWYRGVREMHCDRTHGTGTHVSGALVSTCEFARVRWCAVLDVITRVGRHVSMCSLVRWRVLRYSLVLCHYTCVCRRC